MGAWQKELDRVLEQSVTNKKFIDESTEYYQKVVDEAQAFVGAYTKAAPQFGKIRSELLDLADECGRAAAQLMVLEDELEAAKKAGDKPTIKAVEAKMKPHITSFESTKKEGLKVAEGGNKLDDELTAHIDLITSAIG